MGSAKDRIRRTIQWKSPLLFATKARKPISTLAKGWNVANKSTEVPSFVRRKPPPRTPGSNKAANKRGKISSLVRQKAPPHSKKPKKWRTKQSQKHFLFAAKCLHAPLTPSQSHISALHTPKRKVKKAKITP